VAVQRHASAPLLPEKRFNTNYIGGWVDPWTDAKNLALAGIRFPDRACCS